jgi:hypothetical protein
MRAATLPSRVACVVSWDESKRTRLHLRSACYFGEQFFFEQGRLSLQVHELLQFTLRDGLRWRLARKHQIRVPVPVDLRVSLRTVDRFVVIARLAGRRIMPQLHPDGPLHEVAADNSGRESIFIRHHLRVQLESRLRLSMRSRSSSNSFSTQSQLIPTRDGSF